MKTITAKIIQWLLDHYCMDEWVKIQEQEMENWEPEEVKPKPTPKKEYKFDAQDIPF